MDTDENDRQETEEYLLEVAGTPHENEKAVRLLRAALTREANLREELKRLLSNIAEIQGQFITL